MSLPAVLYLIQNNLQFLAVGLLEPGTFQVLNQLKIPTTALFSIVLLDKRISARQWISLLILMTGIGIVQISNLKSKGDNQILGFYYIIIISVLSGISGVWFEKVLKTQNSCIYLGNIQLSLFGIIFGLLSKYLEGNGQDFLENHDFLGWITILNQAFAGLIVAMVVKYADNILKGFATSISIIISSVASSFIFDYEITGMFVLGSSLVMTATFLYNSSPCSATPTMADMRDFDMTSNSGAKKRD